MSIWDPFFALLVRLFAMRFWRKPRLTILVYHRVLEEYDYLRPDVVTKAQFDEQLSWVKKHFQVMPMATAIACLKENKLPSRALAITFDDGYKDNLTNAVPVLKKHNVSASFFIACNYLHQLPKWDYLTEAIRYTSLCEVSLLDKVFSLATAEDKQAFALEAPELIKQFADAQADQYLSELVGLLGQVELPELMMKVEDLQVLLDSGMEVGAHSVSHVILSRVKSEQANREIANSKQILEDSLGVPIKGFAYPNGLYPIDLTDEHVSMVEKAGYEYAVTTNIGCSDDFSERFALRRFTPWRRSQAGFLAELCVNLWRD